MKNLIKVFLVPFIKLWLVYMALHLLIALLIMAVGMKPFQASMSGLLVFLFLGFLFISPIYLNVKTNAFVKNISWMINSARNRTQLVIYYHLELILRILLTLAPAFLYYYLATEDNHSAKNNLNFFSGNYLLMILGTWAAANFVGLSMSSLKRVDTPRISRKMSARNSTLLIFIFLFTVYLGDIIIGSPIATEWLLIIISFLFLVYVYSNHFVLFRKKTRNIIFVIGSLLLFIPSIISIKSLVNKIENSDTSLSEYYELGSLVNYIDISNRDKIFKSITSKKDLEKFLSITEETDKLKIIDKISNKDGVGFTQYLLFKVQNKLDLHSYKSLLAKLKTFSVAEQDEMIKRRLTVNILRNSRIKDQAFIDELLLSDSRLNHFVALQILAFNRPRNEFKVFKQSYQGVLDPSQVERIK